MHSAKQSLSNSERASGAVCLGGREVDHRPSGGAGAARPGPLARDDGRDSWPPLCSPLLPPAGPCSPGAPAWNPGLAAASAPTLSSAQLSWPQQRQPHVCCWGQLRRHLQRSLIYLLHSLTLLWQLHSSLPCSPCPMLSLCTNNNKNNDSNHNQGSRRTPCTQDSVLLVSHILPMSKLRHSQLGKWSTVTQPARRGVRIQTQMVWLQSP